MSRLRGTAWSIVQASVAAALAWEFATRVLGHQTPFFAAVAAVVCLGLTNEKRLRRVGELAVGVTIGVGLGDLLVRLIGSGGWQIAVVVGLAMAAAQLLDGGPLVTAQAGLQAIFVTVLPQPAGGSIVRWEDAVVGGVTALLVAAVAPGDPRPDIRARGTDLVGTLAAVVAESAAAVRTRDVDRADAALTRLRATQSEIDSWRQALNAGDEISRISPIRRRRRPWLSQSRQALRGVDMAIRNMRVALRHVVALLERGERLPEPVAQTLDDLAAILRAIRHELEVPGEAAASRAALVAFAPRLDPARLCADSLSATVVVAQVRSAVVDLLGLYGMDAETARTLLPH